MTPAESREWLQANEEAACRLFRTVFCENPEGQRVFATIMNLGGFWDPCETEEDRIERNFVCKLLDIMQVTREDNRGALAEYIANHPVIPVFDRS